MAHSPKCLIDQETGIRTRPMRVLVLGMCRTATLSMYTALQKLGYNPHHMAEVMKSPTKNLALWQEAMEAKYNGKGRPFGRVEFDKLLGNYDAVTDIPSCLFADELIAAYPEAQVILTIREPDKWIGSMRATVLRCIAWPIWNTVTAFEHRIAGPLTKFQKSCMVAMTGGADHSADYLSTQCTDDLKRYYIAHYENIRRLVGADSGRLLEFEPQEGYEKLCAFLGKDVPVGEDYPNINESLNFVNMQRVLAAMATGVMMLKTVVPIIVALGVYQWYQYRT